MGDMYLARLLATMRSCPAPQRQYLLHSAHLRKALTAWGVAVSKAQNLSEECHFEPQLLLDENGDGNTTKNESRHVLKLLSNTSTQSQAKETIAKHIDESLHLNNTACKTNFAIRLKGSVMRRLFSKSASAVSTGAGLIQVGQRVAASTKCPMCAFAVVGAVMCAAFYLSMTTNFTEVFNA
eukprot:TRINITY_DN45680_c0_g1_i1.p1 TRINITY_DN45680_c0_g1~~TRINITY_DN45680_c0_g1_i1.p1  ORF type:complete len:181 (-),score=20.99 TRINITY_DN45680_c0_g1_i1:112-654(-)